MGKGQLLDIVAFGAVGELELGHRVGFAVVFEGAGHIHDRHAICGGGLFNGCRAIAHEVARIGHSVLGDLYVLGVVRRCKCRFGRASDDNCSGEEE